MMKTTPDFSPYQIVVTRKEGDGSPCEMWTHTMEEVQNLIRDYTFRETRNFIVHRWDVKLDRTGKYPEIKHEIVETFKWVF